MLIAFDIGNTNIVAGCFDGESLVSQFRIKTDPRRTLDEYKAIVRSIVYQELGADSSFSASIVSSVVPQLTGVITGLIEQLFGCVPLMVGPGIKTGISIKTTDPAAVGSDRIVNAVAAKAFYGLPALVIDFGTATSFDLIDSASNYLGGCIAPGVELALDSLVRNTAKLPRIELRWPEQVVGRNTVDAMRAGAVRGYRSLVDGLVEQIESEHGQLSHVIATGGLGGLFSKYSSKIQVYDPSLTLNGLRYIASMNTE